MKAIRIGIFGLNRGASYITSLLENGADIVAACDQNPRWLNKAKDRLGESVTYYESFDEFIEHPMDAVLLANYFNEHAPFAIRCLEKGIHVLSECTAAGTMAECVALVRAAEKSKAKYMLCENYPFMKFNREIKRVCDEGTLGKILYAEGEYNHPVSGADTSFIKDAYPYPHHWRNYLPASYYLTHALTPIMYATGAFPRRVTALPVFNPRREETHPVSGKHGGDCAAIISTLNEDGSVFKFTGCASFGAHANSYRVCGEKGQIENLRGMNGKVMLRYNEWDIPEGMEKNNLYEPKWNHKDEELIEKAGHGGGDFLVVQEFLNCIREDKNPPFDAYFATRMSAVAILAHRSLLEEGMPYDVPDFRKEEDRTKWEKDEITPFYGPNGEEPTIPCTSDNDYKPTENQMKTYLELLNQ